MKVMMKGVLSDNANGVSHYIGHVSCTTITFCRLVADVQER